MSPGNEFWMLSHSIQVAGQRLEARRERRREAQQALAEARDNDHLYREIARLRLHLACLVGLLIRQGAVTKETYEQIVHAIDAGDGVADGLFDGSIEDDGTLTAETKKDNLRLRELAQVLRGM